MSNKLNSKVLQGGPRFCIIIMCLLCLNWDLYSQVPDPLPCTSPPNGVGCLCSTAGLLCTPDDLNEFTYTMSSSQNFGGFNSGIFGDLCPGINNQDGVPNNVNWFSFIAWCNDLTMDVTISNCQEGTQGGNSSYGVQMGLFGSCSSGNSGWDPIECFTEPSDACFDDEDDFPMVNNFVANGLVIGNTYYFMMDGCAGSACDITIDVIGECGTGMIDDWTTGLTGPLVTCVGSTDTYMAEDLNGAVEFYYYLDGVLIDDGTELTSSDITWTMPGTYQLCADVSNLPCILETADPPQNCITIEVTDLGMGEITANPEILCPDGTSTITVINSGTSPTLSHYIIVIGPDGTVTQVVNGLTTTITYDACGTFTAYYYSFPTADNPTLPNIGETWTPPDCDGECCIVDEVMVMFEDTEIPVFVNPPADFTVDCDFEIDPIEDLDWTDNCAGAGSVTGDETLTYNECDGGTIKRNWVFIDSCGNEADYLQTITIEPMPPFTYDNPPSDETVSCDAVPSTFPNLTASNGLTGVCNGDSIIMPTVVDNTDDCDGEIVVTWSFTPPCGSPLEHIQTITVLPPDEASFVNPPDDETVNCDAIPTSHPDLMYTNNLTGVCEIMGDVSPTTVEDFNECGGTITNTWEFTDDCDRVITHTQIITISPPDAPVFTMMPPDMDIPCGDPLPPPVQLTATNMGAGTCLIDEIIDATVEDNTDACDGTIVYTWDYMNSCGTTLTYSQTLTIMPPDAPVFDNLPSDETIMCSEIPSTPQDLTFTNNLTGDCEISGTVMPVVTDNSDDCGGTIEYVWEYTDLCDRVLTHTQVLTIEPVPLPEFTSLPEDMTIDCGDAAVMADPLDYTNGESGDCEISGSVDPVQDGEFDICGATVTFTWEFTDDCDNTITHSQVITVNPSAEAVFLDAPEDITVACADFDENPPMLDYDNMLDGVCEISGSVPGELIGEPGPCGDDVMFMWTFIDDCNRPITHTQNITIEAAAPPEFDNLPGDITVDCDFSNVIPNLDYSNGATGICDISGFVVGFQTGTYDECGGMVTYTWTLSDECNTVITHSQFIEVLPAPDPVFLNPPEDITLACGDEVPPPSLLEYSNSSSVSCLINGFVDPTVINGSSVTEYIWSYTNDCTGNTIEHTQFITGVSTPDITVNPMMEAICIGESYGLDGLIVTDLNGQSLTLQYFDGNGQELFDPNVSPTVTTIYTILATNEDGCQDEIQFTLQVDTPPIAGGDGEAVVCASFGNYDLFDYLIPPYDLNGSWFDTDFSGANIDNPMSANFAGVLPGTYTFTYLVPSTNACPEDEAIVEIEVVDELDFEILSAECNESGTFYTILVFSNGFNITSSAGDINIIDNNTVEITNISLDETVVVSAIDPISFCISDLFVSPPNCDCPDVPAPVSDGDATICFGDAIPTLSVTVESGLSANWYDAPNGGTLVAEEMLTYLPMVQDVGTYIYYVEAVDINGCVSTLKVPVQLTILGLPMVNDITISDCVDESGNATFTLFDNNGDVNGNASFTFEYFENLADAESGANVLDDVYTTNVDMEVLIVKVTSGAGCISYAEVTIDLLELPSADIIVLDEVCIGEENGSVTIENGMPTGNTYSLNGVDFTSDLLFDSLAPGGYTLYLNSADGCTSEVMFGVSPGVDLSLEDYVILCSSNGTATDATDDFYTVTFTATNGTDNLGNYTLFLDNVDSGTFPYGENSFELPANDNTVVIELLDEATGCSFSLTTDALISCSTDCEITIDVLDFVCDDNGSDTNPSDDTYLITVNATAINGAANNMYSLLIDGVPVNTFTYGIESSLTLPADGSSPLITISDLEDPQCFSAQSIGPLNPCSNTCVIDAVIDVVCNDNGTTGVEGDDFYTITINANGTNTAATFNLLINNVLDNAYNFGVDNEIMLPADNSIASLQLVDADDATCTFTFDTAELAPCSGSCEIEAAFSDVVCSNENTGSDALDDTYTAELIVTVTDGSGSYLIQETNTPISSGVPITVGPFLIADGDVTFTILDVNIASCVTMITIPAPPPCSVCEETVDAGNDTTLDCEITIASLEGSSSSPGDATWTGPGGFSVSGYSASTMVSGEYVLTVDFGEGCIVSDTAVVDVSDDIPVANAGEDDMITCEVDTVLLEGSVIGGNGNFSYAWYDEFGELLSNNISFVVSNPGNYFFEVTDLDTDCVSPVDALTVLDATGGPSAIIYADPGDVLDCVIELIYISSDEEENVVYSWMVNNMPVSATDIVIDEPSEIVLMALDTITGCSSASDLMITSLEVYPLIDLAVSNDIDCIVSEATIDGSNSQDGETIEYSWYNEANELIATGVDELTVQDAGVYYLELIDSDNGCVNRDTIEVLSNEEFIEFDVSDDAQLTCDETMVDLSASIAVGNTNVLWTTADGVISTSPMVSDITVTSAGTYIISVENLENSCISYDTVVVLPAEEVTGLAATLMDESCIDNGDGMITIDAAEGGTPPYTYFLDNDEIVDGVVGNLSEGTYTLQVVDANSCSYETEVVIEVLDAFTLDLIPVITATVGETVVLNANVNLDASEIGSIQWSPSVGLSCDTCLTTNVDTEVAADEYLVTVTDIHGCISTATVRLELTQRIEVTIPNIISSNNDNNGNDEFTIYTSDENVVIQDMKIFDRWGELVFSKQNFAPNNPAEGWDGTFKGEDVVPGVYVYYAELRYLDGEIENYSGDVTVLR